MAWLIGQRSPGQTCSLGLTSAAHYEKTRAIGYYDEVATYDQIADLAQDPTVFIDVAGSAPVRAAVHAHFGERLLYSCALGGARWREIGQVANLAGPQPKPFFAPTQAQSLAARWGEETLRESVGAAFSMFRLSAETWMKVSQHRGPAAVEALYHEVLKGALSPQDAAMASIYASLSS